MQLMPVNAQSGGQGHPALYMQTEVATENTQDSKELEARKRSAKKWRKRFIWLPVILSILIVPGCIVEAISYPPQDIQVTNLGEAVYLAASRALSSLICMMPPMLFLAPLVGWPLIYSSTKLFFMVIGVAIGLSIVNGCYWFLFGLYVAADILGPDPVAGSDHLVAFTFYLILMPALAIAAVVGGVSGLLYGWFRELHG